MPFAALASIAAGIGGSVFQNYMNRNNAKQQQKWTQENMELANSMQIKQNQLATPLAVQSMRDAGISPALMTSPMSPSSAPNSQQGASSAPYTLGDLASLANIRADISLKESQAKLLDEQATQQDIQNKRDKMEDSVASSAIVDQMEMQKEIYKEFGVDTSKLDEQIQRVVEDPEFNIGAFRANLKAFETSSASLQAFTNKLENLLKQNNDYYLLKNRPTIEAQLMEKKLSLDLAQIYYLGAQAQESRANTEKIAQERKNLVEQINVLKSQGKLNEAQANSIANADVNTLINNGEIGKAVTAELTGAFTAGVHGTGQGFGFALGSRLGGLSFPRAGSVKSFGSQPKHFASPFKPGSDDAVTYDLLANRVGIDKAKTMLGAFLESRERKLYSNNFTAWLGAVQRSNGKILKR